LNRALFISDLHLCAGRPGINTRFFAFLEERAARAGALYVLGDLFDYWIGDDELDAPDGDPLGRRVAEAFGRLARGGVAVRMMHGNRDFLLGARFLEIAGAGLLEDPARADLDGVATLLMHGDTLCTDDVAYQEFRAQARSAAWQSALLSQPLARRRRLVAELREKSEQVKRDTRPEIMDVNDVAVQEAFRRHRVRRLVHGHTHRPGRHLLVVDGRPCERWVLPDWYDGGGYLEIAAGVPRLMPLE
jgi:UDP-2,3-diacylglucosamine hydrolase